VIRFLALLFLIVPALAHGQDLGGVVLGGKKPTPQDVANARGVLAALEDSNALALEVGEYEVVKIKEENGQPVIKGPVAWFSINSSIIERVDVPANQSFPIYLKRKGQPKAVYHVLPPQKYPYWLLIGVSPGASPFLMVQNGEAGKPPSEATRLDVTVGKLPDPGPGPGPNPPGPTPIPAQGLRVLIVWETKDLSTYPASQIAAVNAREVREYLNAKCIKVGTQPEWRVYDPDTDVSRESKIWQDAMKIKRDKLPWIVVSDGVKGTSEPLPLDKDALMTLLKTYGGN
jgi:hypothetical protein